MGDKDKVDAPIEESDIDHINSIISSSEESVDKGIVESEDIHKIEPKISEDEEIAEKIPDKIPEMKRTEHRSEIQEIGHKIEHKDVKKAEHKIVPQHHKEVSHHKEVKEVPKEIRQVHKEIPKAAEKHISEPIKHAEPIKHPRKTVKPVVKPTVKPAAKQMMISRPIVKTKIVEQKKIARHEARPEMKNIRKIEKPVKAASKNVKNNRSFKEDKMADHKGHNKENNKENKKKDGFKFSKNTLLWIGIGVLAAILVIALVLILSPKIHGSSSNNQTNQSVAATVNGEPIYLQDVLQTYNNLNPLVKSSSSIEAVLNSSIDEALLYQEAKTQDITATDSEIQYELGLIKEQNNMTDSQLETVLANQGLTIDSVKGIIGKNIMVRKLLNSTILKDISVTSGDIEAYYQLNMDKFKVPEEVTVQHILVMVSPNVTENESKAKIEQINKELTSTNFCELVIKYSDDQGSKNNCGIYTFGRGQMVPEFENPSFSLGINETAIVKSVYGYHLIKKLESIPARTENLSEVQDSINQTVYEQDAQLRFESLLAKLRSKAVIVNYVTKKDTNTNASTSTGNASTASLDAFAKCLTSKNAIFYGAYWCPHCNDQKQLFGDSMQYINYVECAVEGQPQVQTKACTDAGISGYPTWIVDGKAYPGAQTFESLAKMTGCAAPQ